MLPTDPAPPPAQKPLGAHAMIGFAHCAGHDCRTTAEWMQELREGDTD